MKTSSISAVVAMLAMFAVAGCSDEGTEQGSLNPRAPTREPSGSNNDDNDNNNNAGGSDNSNSPGTGAGTGNGTGAGNGTGTGNGTGAGNGTGNGNGSGAGNGSGTGNTAVLNTYSKVWVSGDDRGPNKLGKITGAGMMDAAFAWDKYGYAKDKSKVLLGTVYTRSSNQPNNNNSYMQGGFAVAELTETGVKPLFTIDHPNLNGDRTFMRPLIGFTATQVITIAASEDNGVNNNPQPVLYINAKSDGAKIQIANSTRGGNNINKPTNLIQQALKDGINVNNPNNQRGPHTIQQISETTFVVGMQYNNQAQEAFSVTVNPDNTVKMNWLERYSNTAQHCRPQVAIADGSKTGYIAAVEANNQPAEIGFRVTSFNVDTGKKINSKIAVRSQPNQNKYVSEPVLGILGDKLAITYGLSSQVRNRNGDNGHAGGKKIDAAVLLNANDFSVIGEPILGVGQFGRHGSSFITGYGPNAEPALAVISGSSTGTGGGFLQLYPMKTDGTLGVKDAAKVYPVSPFADVANVQARGKRNPNNQARGFINGMGNVPNPGYTTDASKIATNFMPEVKQFSFSTVTGYSGPEAKDRGLKNSVWLSLVPAAWQEGLQTVPGKPTETPGTNTDGTGPAPRTNGPATNPSGESGSSGDNNVLEGTEDTKPNRAQMGETAGCSAAPSTSTSGGGAIALALAGIVSVFRRRRSSSSKEA